MHTRSLNQINDDHTLYLYKKITLIMSQHQVIIICLK